MSGYDLREAIAHIPPADLSYNEWLAVGMALKEEGYTAQDWEEWSRGDPARYHSGECGKKWESFKGDAKPVTAGSIVKLARSHGWIPATIRGRAIGKAIGWDDYIGICEEAPPQIVDRDWLEGQDIPAPDLDWNPSGELTCYLKTLFEPDDYVGYVVTCTDRNGKPTPTKGYWDRTAQSLIRALEHCKNDLGSALGDWNPEAGAWIRFNPLDGRGITDKNITDYRYALVESDEVPIEKQNALIRELELPVAALVHSGGKSLHAIVKINAPDEKEYRRRVDYLYQVCEKNGLKPDKQNRNPSRLSRMPGITRNGKKQFLVDTNIGKGSWQEWVDWIESVSDDLPDPEEELTTELPELAPALIENVLRQGHKMLLAGPSKAGKSYALIELAVCIAEGLDWLGFRCTQGKVMYVNLELDRASCLHRFRDVRQAMGAPGRHSVDIWNLRGHSLPMDKLAPKLIRRAMKKDYLAIIIDPIYKVITGDENSADQMARFCNQFDKVCTELGCAVIYCHHHSKGSQGSKRSMDRASGSGVFARDPDALLDLIELPVEEPLRKHIINSAVCEACSAALMAEGKLQDAPQDDLYGQKSALEACKRLLSEEGYQDLTASLGAVRQAAEARTAWRIEGTLREFPKFPPVDLWFEYPVHCRDESGVLGDAAPNSEPPSWQKKKKKDQPPEKSAKQRRQELLDEAFGSCDLDGTGIVTLSDLAEYTGKTTATMKNWATEHPDYELKGTKVKRVQKN